MIRASQAESAKSATLLSHGSRVAYAFARLDFFQAISYPLNFVLGQLAVLVPIFIYFFIGRLVPASETTIGGDFFTFVVVGLVGLHVLSGALRGFGSQLEMAMQYGQLEGFLVEPIRWRLLPFVMIQWTVVWGTILGIGAALLGAILGADFRPAGLPVAVLILALGVLASIGIGTLSAGLLLLAKKSQAVLTLYTLAASVLSGVFFPIELLPESVQRLSWLIPHTYAISALRSALMASPPQTEITIQTALIALVMFNLVVLPLGVWLFGRALQAGRRLGALGGY